MLRGTSQRKRNSGRRGSAMVEFALTASFLVSLFIGVVTFGYDFYVYNRLESIVRSGARFASIQTYDSNTGLDPRLSCRSCNVVLSSSDSNFARRTANFTAYGTPEPGDNPQALVEDLSPNNVTVSLEVKNNMPVNVWVSITGHRMLTPAGAITLNGKPATSFPWMGRAAIAP